MAPLPGSTQTRLQQVVPLEQGLPSWLQPPPPEPVTATQSAALPDGAPVQPLPQQLPQQSEFARHTSPSAWHE